MISEIASWAQVVAVAFAGAGLVLTALQISRSIRQRRIERIDQVRQELFGDPALISIYYRIEYSEFDYSPDFHGSEDEKNLDQLLSMFDSLAKQVQMKLLNLSDLDLVAYEYLVIYQDSGVREYFKFLDNWFSDRGIRHPPFKAFQEVGRLLEKHGYGHDQAGT